MPHLSVLLFALLLSTSIYVVQSYDDLGFEFVPFLFPVDRMPTAAIVQGECLARQLDFCQKEFATALGTDVGIFSNPSLFVALLSRIYKKDADQGLIPMCNARNQFNTCLGMFYGACTDLFNIMRDQKLGPDAAFTLADVYNNIEFDCSAGFTQAITNWQCIVYVHNSAIWKTKSADCYNTFNSTVNDDQTAFCPASEVYSTCLADIYKNPAINTCDFKEIMWWECERALRRSKLDGFCDTITCQKIFGTEPKTRYSSIAEQNDDGGLILPAMHRYFQRAPYFGWNRKKSTV